MTTAPRRPLGPGRTDLPEPVVRDRRAMTAAERAAAGGRAAEPAPAPGTALLTSRLARRRRLGGGPADAGTTSVLLP
ncbi:hypothetical protein [Streptomyces sp. NBC_00094]|uniref:hypothetical protein n=1 Tax=Streptomyces sp. NBC_00094 TaxID=2903620 RepID=UPI00224FD3CA|nr:hypothetical protein [Streptomyces sp. NBC_00094]MCX5395382.1 hypothetical protein [Streptomyces sp. NBC_00094]